MSNCGHGNEVARHNFKDAGRVCPVDYHLDQTVWASEPAPEHCFNTLLVVGGLYGNPFAGEEVRRIAAAEAELLGGAGRVGVVYNGDMHWFDRTAEEFARVEQLAKGGTPLVGNVEAEVRRDSDVGVGCGCAYPSCTDDASVSRSNRIHRMMRDAVRQQPELVELLQGRPGHMVAQVGDCKVGITHGDEKLLGGWDCSLEQLEQVTRQAELSSFMAANGIDVFATTHTCAAVAAKLSAGVVINNGAAGLPTFRGQRFGILTRIADTPCEEALYRCEHKGLFIEAVPVHYDHEAFLAWFDSLWPRRSPAEVSYRKRILEGPACTIKDALLGGFKVMPTYAAEARGPVADVTLDDLEEALAHFMYFEDMVPSPDLLLTREHLATIQVNVGKRCNLACAHCHVGAGPSRTEMIDRSALQAVLDAAAHYGFETVDLTGGAPEMCPDFRWFICEARAAGLKVMVRTNLVILLEESYRDLISLFAELGVVVIASLPNFSEAQADAQRGGGVFQGSIEALRQLNAAGYGTGNGLELDLVFNPQADVLPPSQEELELLYRERLGAEYSICFDHLFVVTNNPVGRYGMHLLREGALDAYMCLLLDAFNPEACEKMMCRDQISVGWDGRVYDCDFNQVEELPCKGPNGDLTIFDLAAGRVQSIKRPIRFGNHCYACTAGAGSSCGGTLVQAE